QLLLLFIGEHRADFFADILQHVADLLLPFLWLHVAELRYQILKIGAGFVENVVDLRFLLVCEIQAVNGIAKALEEYLPPAAGATGKAGLGCGLSAGNPRRQHRQNERDPPGFAQDHRNLPSASITTFCSRYCLVWASARV